MTKRSNRCPENLIKHDGSTNADYPSNPLQPIPDLATLGLTDRDSLLGGDGNDTITGAIGADYLDGQSGADIIDAQSGGDTSNGLDTIVSDSRSFLADLFYTLRDWDLAIYAVPSEGFPPHHYAQKHPLTPGPGDVLYLARGDGPPACRDGSTSREITSWRPETGYYTRDVVAFRVPRSCWFPPA